MPVPSALAEQADCRRGRLLSYFGESLPLNADGKYRCGNCDNCLDKPTLWDGTDAARKLLSTIYRVQQMSGINFGAGHIMDILRGKKTEKVAQFGHETISTFGIGASLSETQLRSVLRQLIATGSLNIDATAFNTLQLNDASRAVLKGDVKVMLREPSPAQPAKAKAGKRSSTSKSHAPLDAEAERRFAALKAWRFEVAREHNLPAYVIFHDATLIAIAEQNPSALHELADISGMGVKKLEAYGEEVLRAVRL